MAGSRNHREMPVIDHLMMVWAENDEIDSRRSTASMNWLKVSNLTIQSPSVHRNFCLAARKLAPKTVFTL